MATIGQSQSEYQKLHIRYVLFAPAINGSRFVQLHFWYEDNGRIVYASLIVWNFAPLLCSLELENLCMKKVELFLLSWVFCKSVSLAGFETDKT